MKSASTLIPYHEKAILVLEFMQKAKDRVTFYKTHLKLWNDRHRSHFVHSTYKREGDIIQKIITANRVYIRIRNYYFNILKHITQ